MLYLSDSIGVSLLADTCALLTELYCILLGGVGWYEEACRLGS